MLWGDLNEEAETGNILQTSTHLSIQMSSPQREHPRVNIKSSGHDPLQPQDTDSMGNQTLRTRNTAGLAKIHLL